MGKHPTYNYDMIDRDIRLGVKANTLITRYGLPRSIANERIRKIFGPRTKRDSKYS